MGQRPARGSARMAEIFDLPMNAWGYLETEAFSLTRTSRQGVLLAGACGGLKDIGESVITASAAALNATRVIHSTGGVVRSAPAFSQPPKIDRLRRPPRIAAALCTCDAALAKVVDLDRLTGRLQSDPAVCAVSLADKVCTAEGMRTLTQAADGFRCDRLLLGACMPLVYARKKADLSAQFGLDPRFVEIMDIQSPALRSAAFARADTAAEEQVLFAFQTGIARLKRSDPDAAETAPSVQKALVVGAGIAGMSAALGIAENGFHVDLIEARAVLGGQIRWLGRTLDGNSPAELLNETVRRVEKHPLIVVHTQTRVAGAHGRAGRFVTTLKDGNGQTAAVEHGAVIIATGGAEAESDAYGHGAFPEVVTQKELEEGIAQNRIDPRQLNTVVMIQCVGSRVEPRNYCSRICCTAALKNALALKGKNPDIDIFVFYRDMMSYGFAESAYTRARAAGVVFIRYEPEHAPKAVYENNRVVITGQDPVVDKRVEIESDLLVLAVGIVPTMPKALAEAYGATADGDGFFEPAESKWRPVDALAEGVFACGLALAPHNIPESIATAEAAAQRALRLLVNPRIQAGNITAKIHPSLCSLCRRCIEACPYQARFVDPEEEKVRIDPIRCQGCGACAAVCPTAPRTWKVSQRRRSSTSSTPPSKPEAREVGGR